MCVLALAWHAHPRWKLVAAGNRDELHERPAGPLERWGGPGDVIAGRDLASGGTWLGVSEEGRFAVVTNLRGHGAPDPERPSRGALVADLLAGTGRFAEPSDADLGGFNSFNFAIADGDELRFMTNRPHPERARLPHGIYGLSNGPLDEPWPKTLRLKAKLIEWMTGDEDPLALLEALGDGELPDLGIDPETASDAPLEPQNSPIFIRHALYGTRCSTVVAVNAEGRGVIAERRYRPSGDPDGETRLEFRWPN